MKKLAAVLMALPLAACINESDSDSVSVSGYLPTDEAGMSELGALTEAGSEVGGQSQTLLGDTLNGSLGESNEVRSRSLSPSPQPRALIVQPQSCEGQQGSFSVDLTDNALTFIFDECAGEEGTVDGQIGFSLGDSFEQFADQVMSGIFDFTLTVNYGDLTAINGDDYVYLNGDVTTEWLISETAWEYGVTSGSLTYRDSVEHDFRLNNFEFDMQGDTTQNEGSLNTQWTYDYFITNEDGTFHVKSVGPIMLVDGLSEKRDGQITIEGVNALLTITLDSDGDDEVVFSLDIDKDGTEDVTGTSSQADFYNWVF